LIEDVEGHEIVFIGLLLVGGPEFGGGWGRDHVLDAFQVMKIPGPP
jgi:hypothetical protein